MPLKRNCTKVVSVQKTGPPVLRNEKTRKSTVSGKKKRLHHHWTRNVHFIARATGNISDLIISHSGRIPSYA